MKSIKGEEILLFLPVKLMHERRPVRHTADRRYRFDQTLKHTFSPSFMI